ncbi:Serine/threonine-protein kinase Pkn1 [Enhygromyxa salina]|uniref:non-specific serine/threonine protein kinase n=1 Tax=Enhygromyxa salina TaxID=215803 RepID=A0A2S9YES9_9BACT|nr:serine/threonine-protein kinase [Enhygromyxa salina]PRQ03609.1 Serine/threonine-protein kinase Pkn1 [Enhygromyxa salina]
MSEPTELNPGGPPQIPGWKPPPDLIGTVLADRYKVVSTLGDGGMGSVYLGEHVTLRKKVAIKVLKQEFCHDRTNVERFLQEARAASMIRHENIVDIMDFGQVPGGSVFFVMELLEGSDLSDLLKEVKRLPWLRTRNILLQVVRALRAAHESGIIHRDMKPGNVFLIARSSATDYVKVLDFGIAKVDDQNTGLTRTGAVFGTAGYMAPEQACGDPVDGRTDVYAVGCMMFEMLTGRTPFPGNNFMRVLTQHMNEPAPPPRDVNPDADISDEVETIILTALSKKAEDRFPDMAAFEKAIAQANGEVATVPPQNRARTPKGTLLLDDEDNISPFAGMTPGQPPPGYIGPDGGSDGGEGPGTDATMMLDGMGGVSLGSEGGGGEATMMLDGMGGFSLGNEGPGTGEATMMLDGGLPDAAGIGNDATMTAGDQVAGAAAPVEESKSRKKLYMMLGGGAAVLGLILALVFGLSNGDDKDEVAEDDEAAETGDSKALVAGAESGGEELEDSGPPEPEDTGEPVADTGGDAGAVEAEVPVDLPVDPPVDLPSDTGTEDTPEVSKPVPKPVTIRESLSANDVNKGLKRISKKVSACKNKGGLPGMKIKVNFLISGGKVKSASARPPHSSTPVGKCVASAVKSARFTKAKQSKIVDHTFTL